MSSLYKLTSELEDLLQNEEATDEQITEAFGNITEKAEKVCQFIAVLDGEIAIFKAEEKRISDKRKYKENMKERTKEALKTAMTLLMIDKLPAGTFNISLSPTAGKVMISDESALDSKYYRVEEVFTVDKKAIKDDINAGQLVPGAYIEEGTSLRIK